MYQYFNVNKVVVTYVCALVGFLCKIFSSLHGYGQDKAVIICRLHSSIRKFVFFIHHLVPRFNAVEGVWKSIYSIRGSLRIQGKHSNLIRR
jgi:hypothetical protein